MDDDVRRLVASAAGPSPSAADVEAIQAGVRRRRRTRQILTASTALVLILALVAIGDWRPPGRVQVFTMDASALSPFDPTVTTGPAAHVPTLSRIQIEAQPTLQPPGYRRCAGPTTTGRVTTTRYCGPGADITLHTGAHTLLPETGDPIQIGSKTAWFQRLSDQRGRITISDQNSPVDTHYQLDVPASIDPGTAAAILASIPDINAATHEK